MKMWFKQIDINISDKEKISMKVGRDYKWSPALTRVLYKDILRHKNAARIVFNTSIINIPDNYNLDDIKDHGNFLIQCGKYSIMLNTVISPDIIIDKQTMDMQPNIIELVTDEDTRINIRDLYYIVITSCNKIESGCNCFYEYNNIYISNFTYNKEIVIRLKW